MIKIRLLRMLADSRRYLFYEVAGQWVGLLSQIVVVWVIASLLAALLNGAIDTALFVPGILMLAAALLVRYLADRLAARSSYQASVEVKRIIREKIYDKLLSLGASYQSYISTAELVQMTGEGAEQLETYFGRYVPQLAYSILAPLTLFAFLAPVSFTASLVLLVCVPLIPLVIVGVQKIAERLLASYWGSYTNLGDSFLENLQGLTTLKIYQADQDRADRLDEESERFRIATMRVLRMQLNSIIVMDVIAYGGAAIGMIVALSQFFAGEIGFSATLMIILLAADFFIPMRQMGSFFHIAMNGMAASDKMFAFLDLPDQAVQGQKLGDGPLPIRFHQVGFSYTEDRQILNGVDMTCAPGSPTSLVGASGCGKSTVANIIMGRNKGYTGSVTIGGIELSSVDEASLMKHATMVGSQSYLFTGTVRDNLRMGDPNASDERMEQMLAQVALKDFFDGQQGLDTLIAEEGGNLSGGQRQRLAIARALLHDTPVYLFDEATSNIDIESEEIIMRIIRELAKTRTIILVSHRLANVIGSDCIYLLDAGSVAERGTHEQLLEQQGAYARLYRRQRELEAYGTGVA